MLLEEIDTRQVYYRTISIWPIALAVLIRLAIWLVIPPSRFASDEDSYFQVATAFLGGRQDLFWPPVTGWLIALVRWVTGADSVAMVRLAWIAMDAGCCGAVLLLARRLGRSLWPEEPSRAARLAGMATVGYAIYLPAISFSQFATSEIPALLLTLLMLVIITTTNAGIAQFAGAGLLAGVACLTRPSLLPLLIVMPVAATWRRRGRALLMVMAFIAAGASTIGMQVLRNWSVAGEATISTNSAYNLFIGNRDMYAEDLDLFHPRATPEQIEFRQLQFSGRLPPITQTPAESQRLAVQWIREHPLLFARRALGRLARVFVPKTDVLELIGGEARAGVRSPAALALLIAVNLQWMVVLAGGVTGLFVLRRRHPQWALTLTAVIAAALPLCLVAISKPRYSFVFDPILIIAAAVSWMHRKSIAGLLTRADRWSLAVIAAFLGWAWIAFTIFAVSSRAAM